METRICRKCNKLKDFDKPKTKGNEAFCAECRIASRKSAFKRYEEKNKEKRREKDRKYFKNNKEKVYEKNRKYNEKHKERKAAYKKIYNKKYGDLNKDKRREYNKVYGEKNKEILNKKSLIRKTEMAKTDPLFKLKTLLRSRTRGFFKSVKVNKSEKTEVMLGVSYETAKLHIENKFKKEMTWENHGRGGWHIDHIIPLSSAKNEEELIKLCHYTNLQPMWEKENLLKGSKIPQVQIKLTI